MAFTISFSALLWGFILTVAGMFGGFEYSTALIVAVTGIMLMLLGCVLSFIADMWGQ